MLALGVVALLAFLLHGDPAEDRGAGPLVGGATPPQDKEALPEAAGNLDALWTMADRAAAEWRSDARLVRLYASAVHPDGGINRATSDVQFVYVSTGLTALGPGPGTNNGFRWSLSGGRTSGVEISHYPAPSLDGPEPRRCDLAALCGEGAPAEVIVDVSFAERLGRGPDWKVFTADRHFALSADPFTCALRGRATPRTFDELAAADAGDSDAGRPFDQTRATSQLEGALKAAAACKTAGAPVGPGTVSVRFDRRGKVEEVQFQMGGYQGTETGRFIEGHLRRIEVKPWDSGRGFVVKRFSL